MRHCKGCGAPFEPRVLPSGARGIARYCSNACRSRARVVSLPMARITPDEVRGIRAMRAGGERVRAVAAHFGVALSTVSKIANRKAWREVV